MKLAVVKRRKAGDTELLRGETAWQRLFVIMHGCAYSRISPRAHH